MSPAPFFTNRATRTVAFSARAATAPWYGACAPPGLRRYVMHSSWAAPFMSCSLQRCAIYVLLAPALAINALRCKTAAPYTRFAATSVATSLEQPALTDNDTPNRARKNRSTVVRPANLFWVDTTVTSTVKFEFPADSVGKFARMSTALNEQ